MQGFPSDRMDKTEFGGVQSQAWSTAFILERRSIGTTDIDRVTTNGMTGFAEVNADLMGATRFESAREKGITAPMFFGDHVRDGFFADGRKICAAAAAIATIFHQSGTKRLCGHNSRYDGEVAAQNGMPAELQPQSLFSKNSPGKNEQPTRFTVESVDNSKSWDRFDRPVQPFGNGPMGKVEQCGIKSLVSIRPEEFGWMADAVDAGSFFDHDDVIVEMSDHEVRR